MNVRFLKPFVEDILLEDLQKMPVFTLEDHVVETGFGAIAAQTAAKLPVPYKLQCFGIKADDDISFGEIEKLHKSLNLDKDSIAENIRKAVDKINVKR